jgi:hypothetical protein
MYHQCDQLEYIGGNQYRCKKLGFVVTTKTPPVVCDVCGTNPQPPIGYPSVVQMAISAAKAVISYAADGFKNVDNEEYQRRLDICTACEFFDVEQIRCKKCGCFVKLKAVINANNGGCPLNKWKQRSCKHQ